MKARHNNLVPDANTNKNKVILNDFNINQHMLENRHLVERQLEIVSENEAEDDMLNSSGDDESAIYALWRNTWRQQNVHSVVQC